MSHGHSCTPRARSEKPCCVWRNILNDPALAVLAHYALGATWLWLGALPAARSHQEAGIARYTPDQHRTPAFRIGQDLGVGCRVGIATTLWLLGYPEQALARLHEALALAHALSHPYSLGFARVWAAWVYQFCRDVPAVYEQAEAIVTLSTAQGSPLLAAMGTSFRGWALAMQGQGEEGIAGPTGDHHLASHWGSGVGPTLVRLAGRSLCPPGPSRRRPPGAGRGPHSGGAAGGTLLGSGNLSPAGRLAAAADGDITGGSRNLVAAPWTSPAVKRLNRWSCVLL